MKSCALWLASSSPRRRELLSRLTENFSVMVSQFDEKPLMSRAAALSPDALVRALSAGKAAAVWDKLERNPANIVIGGDTVVVSPSDTIFGIPANPADARRMLMALSGQTHRVITGVTLCGGGNPEPESFTVTTRVTFYPLSTDEIDWYLSTGEPFDKAGAYGIQGKGALLVREIQGDYANVVGLPLAELGRKLSKFCANFSNPQKVSCVFPSDRV